MPRPTVALSGLWAKAEVNGEKQWIHKWFHGDIARADSAATAGTAAPAPAPGA